MMIVRRWMVGVCAATFLLAGCGEEGTDAEYGQGTESVTDRTEDATERAEEAADTAGEFMADTKDTMMTEIDGAWSDLKPRIEQLKTRAENTGADTSSELTKAMNELEVKRAEFEAELEDLRNASGDAWRDMTDDVNDAWRELREAFENAEEELQAHTTR